MRAILASLAAAFILLSAGASPCSADELIAGITLLQGASSGGGGPSTVTVQDEGSGVAGTPHSALNFVGAGVTATDGGAGVATVTIPGGGSSEFLEQTFAPTLGQTVFVLGTSHLAGNALSLACINQLCGYREGVSYTVSGTTLTWLDSPFTLDTVDSFTFKHQTN